MSAVGSILYLVKHSRPELSNVLLELSKCMDEANMSHYKVFLHAIKYTIDTKSYCYHMKPVRNINRLWELRDYSDRDFARDNNTRKGVIVYIVLINGAVVAWR